VLHEVDVVAHGEVGLEFLALVLQTLLVVDVKHFVFHHLGVSGRVLVLGAGAGLGLVEDVALQRLVQAVLGVLVSQLVLGVEVVVQDVDFLGMDLFVHILVDLVYSEQHDVLHALRVWHGLDPLGVEVAGLLDLLALALVLRVHELLVLGFCPVTAEHQ